MLLNTPAARLHQILTGCKKHQKESGARPMLMGWRKVFRMPDSASDFSVMSHISRVYAIPAEIVELVGRYNDLPPQLYLGWCEELEEAFGQVAFHSEFDSFVKRIPKTLLVNLEFCSDALGKRCPEPIVEQENLSELGEAVSEFHKQVIDAEMDDKSRRYLLDYLALIQRALERYDFTGSPGLQGALDACTGSVVTQRQVSLPMRETPLGKQFWSLLNKVTHELAPPKDKDESGEKGAKRVRQKLEPRKKAA